MHMLNTALHVLIPCNVVSGVCLSADACVRPVSFGLPSQEAPVMIAEDHM